MKKGILFNLLLVMVLCVATGCGNKIKTYTCKGSSKGDGDLELTYNYTVKYKGDDVISINSVETISTSDEDDLDYYKEYFEGVYGVLDEKLDHYDNTIKVDGNKIISETDIDYSKIDVDKFIEANPANAALFTDGKIKVSTVKTVYQQLGLECK